MKGGAVLVDLGVGNLGNLARALHHLGAQAEVTSDPARIAAARCLLLPGVGAFAPPREALRGAPEAALRSALADGAWLLGICVGFQLLFEEGEEFGAIDGLGLLPGRVTRLPAGVPLPHIGWNRLHDLADDPLVAGLAGEHVYFVHSYAPEGVPAEAVLARATHGRAFAAVAGGGEGGRILGTQFHPERSGEAGLRLLRNYLALAGVATPMPSPPCPPLPSPSPQPGEGGEKAGGGAPLPGDGREMGEGTGVRARRAGTLTEPGGL